MKQAYIDSCVWITAVEGFSEYQAKIDETLRHLTDQQWKFCTSDVVLFEMLLKPMKEGQNELITRYRALFEKMKHLKSYPNVFTEALRLAHIENLKGLDAVHLALASHHRCQLFVSSDPHFRSLTTITPSWIDLSGHAPSAAEELPHAK